MALALISHSLATSLGCVVCNRPVLTVDVVTSCWIPFFAYSFVYDHCHFRSATSNHVRRKSVPIETLRKSSSGVCFVTQPAL